MKRSTRSAGAIALSAAMLLCSACGASEESNGSSVTVQSSTSEQITTGAAAQPLTSEAASADVMTMNVGGSSFSVALEDNETVTALKELLPANLDMSELNGNEKYCYLDTELPSAPEKVGSIAAGDVMLYGDNCLVVFYKSFKSSYSYTRIGHIDDTAELEKALGSGGAAVSFSLNEKEDTQESDVLVAYFSRTGNTGKIAEYLIELTGADSYVINAAVPYSDDDIKYQDSGCRANKEQNDKSARPEIAEPIASIDSYDTILLGYPIWWGEEPRIIDTFLESYDFSDKTVIPFCTSASSGISVSEANIKALVPIGEQPGGRRFAASAKKEDVSEWLDLLGVKKKITEYTAQDLRAQSDFLLGKPVGAGLAGKQYDLDGDGAWTAFDLCLMRGLVKAPKSAGAEEI